MKRDIGVSNSEAYIAFDNMKLTKSIISEFVPLSINCDFSQTTKDNNACNGSIIINASGKQTGTYESLSIKSSTTNLEISSNSGT